MSDWHGYPIPKEAHPKRPWWSGGDDPYLATIWWCRADGHSLARMTKAEADRRSVESQHFLREGETEAEALARIDREHPLPAPPPKVGQVWVKTWADDDQPELVHTMERAVAYVFCTCGVVERVVFSDGRAIQCAEWQMDGGGVPEGREPSLFVVDGAWPPAGAVLVDGVGAPWAPMGEP